MTDMVDVREVAALRAEVESALPARLANRIIVNENECWLWTGAPSTYGYGRIRWEGRVQTFAHRVVWSLLVGPLTPGKVIDHLCRVRNCVNPDHMREVTSSENTMAPGSESLTARNAAKLTCLRGHSDWYFYPNRNKRTCRVCQAARWSKAALSGGKP